MDKQLLNQKIFHLSHCGGIGPASKLRMISALLDNPYLSAYELSVNAKLTQAHTKTFLNSYAAVRLEFLFQHYQTKNTRWLTILDEQYPEYLRQIYNPPVLLFYQGDLSLLEQRLLAVVGSRKSSVYGDTVLDRLLPELIKNDIVTVSGLAKGIDCAVHQKTMRENGKTVAVVGTGLDRVYPYEHKELQEKIGKDHLLLSEYPLGAKPLRHHFPMRNRIIAGLSLGTLVIEAKYRSGSLITANLALQEGREVFAVPGDITNPGVEGTNDLILHGAKCVLSAAHILEEITF